MLPRSSGLATFADSIRYKLYGGVFLLVLGLFCALSVAFYVKAFSNTVPVVLKAQRAGLQMAEHADVKIRGVIVGEVSEITSQDRLAVLHLSLDPQKVEQIPADVKARLLPKTLFGQKYVSLVPPEKPSSAHIRAGAQISEDRSKVAIELNRVFNNVLPLLRSIEPVKLNATLNAIETALAGQGERIGKNLVQLRDYLKKLNPSLPTLKRDISLLADFAETYAAATPDLLRVLDNLTFTSKTVVDEERTLDAFLREVTTFSRTGTSVLAENKQRLIRVNAVNRPTLDLLAQYSPQFPCFLKGLAGLEPRLQEALGGGQPALHITLELVKPRTAYKYPQDLPEYGEDRGPYCYGLPDNPPVPFPSGSLDDGFETLPEQGEQGQQGGGQPGSGNSGASRSGLLDGLLSGAERDGARGRGKRSPSESGNGSAPTLPQGTLGSGSGEGAGAPSHGRAVSPVLTGASMGYAGTAAEQRIVNHLVGPATGTPPRKVPDLAALLFGPMARGTVVQVR